MAHARSHAHLLPDRTLDPRSRCHTQIPLWIPHPDPAPGSRTRIPHPDPAPGLVPHSDPGPRSVTRSDPGSRFLPGVALPRRELLRPHQLGRGQRSGSEQTQTAALSCWAASLRYAPALMPLPHVPVFCPCPLPLPSCPCLRAPALVPLPSALALCPFPHVPVFCPCALPLPSAPALCPCPHVPVFCPCPRAHALVPLPSCPCPRVSLCTDQFLTLV